MGEDPWCTYEPGTDEPKETLRAVRVAWTAEAEARLKKVPFFVRKMVRSAIESLASQRGTALVTPELMDEARRTLRPR